MVRPPSDPCCSRQVASVFLHTSARAARTAMAAVHLGWLSIDVSNVDTESHAHHARAIAAGYAVRCDDVKRFVLSPESEPRCPNARLDGERSTPLSPKVIPQPVPGLLQRAQGEQRDQDAQEVENRTEVEHGERCEDQEQAAMERSRWRLRGRAGRPRAPAVAASHRRVASRRCGEIPTE